MKKKYGYECVILEVQIWKEESYRFNVSISVIVSEYTGIDLVLN